MNPTIKLSIELTPEQVDLVLAGLAELPFKLVNNTCYDIQSQAVAQLQKAQEAQAPAPAGEDARKLELVRMADEAAT